jgi:hypothetical protein
MQRWAVAVGTATALASVVFTAAEPGRATQAAAPVPVQFRAHDIDSNFRGGYAVSVADFNKDGRLDVSANSLQVAELAWYENPGAPPSAPDAAAGERGGWTRHIIARDVQGIVNQAAEDVDRDGIPEVAVQSDFAMQAEKSPGHNWIARHQGDQRQAWRLQRIDSYPTSHRVVWADLDGDGRRELVNAPLIGPKSVAPTFDQDRAPVFWYDIQAWTRRAITTDIPGIVHGLRTVNWDTDQREEILVASFEGVALYKATGSGNAMVFQKTLLTDGHSSDKAPRLGASDVAMGLQNGRKFFATIEPWHGNEVVVYTAQDGKWQRRVLFDKVGAGHTVAVEDLNGDGRGDVIANDNGRVTPQRPDATPGVHVFYAPENPSSGEWVYHRLEHKLAMNHCLGADINSDTRIDLVCTGAGGAVRWYENLGR